ncbi:hypothetical protein V2J09_018170 [Rumex salicifolius]
MIDILPEFKKGLNWKVGNGDSIHFCKDAWCLTKAIADLTGNLAISDPDTRISVFINLDNSWNVQKLMDELPQHIVDIIISTPLPYN